MKEDPDEVRARDLLGQLADMLPQSPTTKDVTERTLYLARQLDWCDSAVLYLLEGDKLVPKEFRTPHREALFQAASVGRVEPVIAQCISLGRATRLSETDACALRVFPADLEAVAIPLRNYGVLYLGRAQQDPFTEASLTRLVALCEQAHFALTVASMTGSRESALQEESHSRDAAEKLLDNVSSIVEMMTGILGKTDPEEVLKLAGESLHRIADFEFWSVVAGPDEDDFEHFFFGHGPRTKLDLKATKQLAKLVIESGRTVSFMNLERLSLPMPSPGIHSILACPMVADSKTVGCLMLGSVRPCFARHERELLSTLALQVGSHYWNLHLHQSLKHSQAQLIQSSKMAAVGQLAAGVAHELNTPLGAMNLAIEGALRILESKPDRAQNRLERALKSGNQLKEIVAKLLHYSKKTDSRLEETQLNNVVNDALELIGHQLKLENVVAETALDDVPSVLANHNEIQQVLINLLTNAKDAIVSKKETQPVLRVLTRATESSVELSVEDNGTGMDRKTVERVFEPFFTTKDVGKGTGLGLSVTKELVERNNGNVAIDSEVGRGTVITLSFPKES